MKGSLLFLGTGASTGVPAIGCDCRVCASSDVRNKRLRTSALLQVGTTKILIDASPDFRQQALSHNLTAPDVLLLTHAHYDHVGGLEEFRAFSYHKKVLLPCYLSKESFESVQKMFYYQFVSKDFSRNRTAEIDFRVLPEARGHFVFNEVPIEYFSYTQGATSVLGFRIGKMAYVTDIKEYSDEVIASLQGVELLVLSAACIKHSHMQMTIQEALHFVSLVKPKETYLIHLSHDIEYESVSAMLQPGVLLAYDGLQIERKL